MVKLSEIIRKTGEEKPQDKPGLISEAAKKKDDMDDLAETKKVYEDAIIHLRPILNEVAKGKTIQGEEIVSIAEVILEQIRIGNDTLLSLINIFGSLGEKEDYIYSHSINISILATNLGLALGYDKSKLIDICVSSLLHDIGMLRIPIEIRNKPSKLEKEEFEVIKKHPALGLDLLNNIRDLPLSAPEIVYQHHERINGTGYPEGKRGDEIADSAKIVAVTELYEAITHPRFYRKEKKIPYDGVKTIVQEAGRSFEPKLVKGFLNFITPYPLGSYVLLNNNEIGRIVGINKNLPLRPVVDIFFDSAGKPPRKSKKVNLASSPVLYIEKAVDDSRL